jgi:hypothetical protein
MLPTPREIQHSPIRIWFVDPYPFPIKAIPMEAWDIGRGLSKRFLETIQQVGEFFDDRELDGLVEKLSTGKMVAFDLFGGKGALLAKKTTSSIVLVHAILWGYDKATARHYGPSRDSIERIIEYLMDAFEAEKMRTDVIFDEKQPPRCVHNALVRSGFRLEGTIQQESILNSKPANAAIYGWFRRQDAIHAESQ